MVMNRKLSSKIGVIILIGLFFTNSLFACTTFVLNDSTNLIYGRNFDWDIGSGLIIVNKRGLQKQAFVQPPNIPAKWISKYGSITFNQIGVDAPMGGMNEKGLIIAQMVLFESRFPETIEKEVVGELEWIQYQLDNSSTLQEVIENNKKIQILPVAVPVHYMICDSKGNLGIIEYLNGELVIKQGDDITIPVCSNMIYEQSKTVIREYEPYGGTKPIPVKWDNITDIVVTANTMINKYDKTQDIIDYGFDILNAVGSSTRTQWSIVFDIANKTINFKTLDNKTTRIISMTNFDFNCSKEIQFLNIHESKSITDIKEQFIALTSDFYFNYKRTLLDLYSSNMQGFPEIPDEVIKLETDYVINLRKCE
jgi:penicillin V acylase-like amidase (Ntn superfamily)